MRWTLIAPDAEPPAIRRYVEWLERNGDQVQVVSAPDGWEACLEPAEALMLIGGGDVEPWRYGAGCHPETWAVDSRKDAAELAAVIAARKAGKPMLGICRGMQVAAVALGGSLIQHVPDVVSESEERHRRVSAQEDAYHHLRACGGGPLARALAGVRRVNSAHHQSVDPCAMGAGIRSAAYSPRGILEAAEGISGSALWLVQWHPERLPPGHPAGDGLRRAWVRFLDMP